MNPLSPEALRPRVLPDTPDNLPETLHPVVRRVLRSRGIDSGAQLNLNLAHMAPPDSLSGLDRAVGILVEAVTGNRRILVVGDFDADGATGTALAMRALRSLGARQVDFRVPNRFEFGYGLTPGLVNALTGNLPEVLITVDSGINCLDGVACARDRGIEVVVTDHHLPGEQLPRASAIVNPNLEGDAFPSKSLAGVGVMFYLLGALRSALRQRGWFDRRREPNLAQLLDLVALGTVADLVGLDHNNRILVRQGLERIRAGQATPGLLALLKAGKRDYRHLVASDLGFAVGPRLNAAGRLEDMSVGIQCLLTDDPQEAERLAGQLDTLNRDRRNLQDAMVEDAEAQVRETLQHLEGELPAGLCLYDPEWHQGIVGLVASRLKDTVHRPVVAFAPESEGSDRLKGSARSIPGLHIRDVLAHVDARHPGMIPAFGGHAMAAGLSLDREHLDRFRNAWEHCILHGLGGQPPSEHLETDGELNAGDLTLELAEVLRDLGPWGQGFPEPVFDGHFDVLDHRVVGGAHLKMKLRHPDGGNALDAIAFRTLPEDLPGTNRLRLIYRLDVNIWRGIRQPQLVVDRVVA